MINTSDCDSLTAEYPVLNAKYDNRHYIAWVASQGPFPRYRAPAEVLESAPIVSGVRSDRRGVRCKHFHAALVRDPILPGSPSVKAVEIKKEYLGNSVA